MKMVSHLGAGAALALLVLATAPSAMATSNPILDGNFSNTENKSGVGYTTYYAGSSFGGTDKSDWTVTSGSVDLISTYWQSPTPPTGNSTFGSVDLDGNNPGALSQTFKTKAGQSYVLSFSLSGNPDGGNPLKNLDVSVGNANETFGYTTGQNSHSSMNYVSEFVDFKATSSTTTLTFTSLDSSSSPYGPVIGKVSVSAVPLPGALPLFGGALVGVGVWARRRAKKASKVA